jgi:molecular chaperone GrpE
MAENKVRVIEIKDPGVKEPEVKEIDELDLDAPAADIESAMREAEAAVSGARAGEAEPAPGGAEPQAGAAAAPQGGQGPRPLGGPDELDRLRREIADLKDRSMRTLADFDNFRKRSERERQEAKRYALFEPLREFIGLVDNLERALSAGGAADDLKRGVEMILRQMQELLRRHGVREVQAAGAPFDPALHEAVSREERPGIAAPTVVEELQRGYQLHDRLLRPAMVKVAVPAEGGKPGDGEGNGSVPAL